MTERDRVALRDNETQAIEDKDRKMGEYSPCQAEPTPGSRRSPSDEDLLQLLRHHPLRTSVVLAAKEMAEYHSDAGRGARQVTMLMNVIDYARLVLRVYGKHAS